MSPLLLASVALAAEAPASGDGTASADAVLVTVDSFTYSPDPVEVTAGNDVRWRWQGDARHSVTAVDGSFDSDPECQERPLLADQCRTEGDPDFIWTARQVDERTEILYRCKLHGSTEGMTGTVVVVPEPAPWPSPSSSPSSPAPSPAASPSAGSTDDEAASGGGTGSGSGRQYEPPPQLGTQTAPGSAGASVASPQVAEPVDDPELEPFPSPAPIPPSASPTELGEVAVDLPQDGDGGSLRMVLLGVAAVAVGGSALAFGKLVLFGPRWR